jgi:biopolymer transport protein ExbB/TolQ
MSRTISKAPKARGSFSTVAAFLFGVPAGLGLLYFLHHGQSVMPAQMQAYLPQVLQYVEHPVEMTEVVMFCCAVFAMLAKIIASWGERAARRAELLPPWDGKPAPIEEAAKLSDQLAERSGLLRKTYLGRRVANILEFAQSRGSANELDDQIRTLSDNDVMAQEGSYSLLRFITWAIPILGFLGTVLGITGAIKGVTPEVLEKSLNGVTDGLATAFDSTALALFLTMILMLCSMLVERYEQGQLEKVDAYVDAELVHRFERTGPESSQFVDALRQNTQVLLKATEQLVERQASVWSRSLEKADKAWSETGVKQQQQLTVGLNEALENALKRHTERLVAVEEKMLGRSQNVGQGMAAVAAALSKQCETLMRLQEGETRLLGLQETLNQNLAALANTGTFEEAVQSLTAAIHLMTSRANPGAQQQRAIQKPAA